jgi:DNA-binding response OmpR family regulator
MPQTILTIDDDPAQLRLIDLTLSAAKYQVLSATNGLEGLRLFQARQPELIVLDVMMPYMDGWEVCERLREISTVPIIFLTARKADADKISGLKIGGDDYLIKPFKSDDLLARVDAVLRRTYGPRQPLSDLLRAGPNILINLARHEVFVRGENKTLRPAEFALLLLFAQHAGETLPAERIATALDLGRERIAERVKWHVWKLRQSIELDPRHPTIIMTQSRHGYLLEPG